MTYKGYISKFIDDHFRHFNAAALGEAARAYQIQIDAGNKMMITLAGAMSTAELGRSLAEMIRQDKVHIIACTGANLEEDVMNLVAHTKYKRIPGYRHLSAQEEQQLFEEGMNRVTDTCIPEIEAFRLLEDGMVRLWKEAERRGQQFLPHEYMYQLLDSGELKTHYDIDPDNSWLLAAWKKRIPVIVPGWEDSTLGNIFAAHCLKGELSSSLVKSGIDYMIFLSEWYQQAVVDCSIGFFQIGGGIAGDFPICVVPMLNQDLDLEVPVWSYFCQISDSTTSYGSYSGAVPNEKISWGKLKVETPKFLIESDASIVAPLIFAHILGW